ncbi:MAG: leucine-rich repeat domain-containing protein [Sedimentisphaerales bacterium]|nr:leucine-rich repeat domain-containing protein [Sedimentisphaerales bacterium]
MKETKEKQNVSKKKSVRNIFIVAVIFLFIVAALVLISFTHEPKSDPASEKIIREAAAKQLNIDPNDMTDEDFAQIKILYIYGKELCDIKLLDKFINLERLDLAAIQFPRDRIPKWMKLLEKTGVVNTNERFTIDLTPLEKLTKMEALVLRHMTIIPTDDVSFLSFPITSEYAPFKNLGPISSLENLKELNLNGALVRDLEPIKKLKNLEILNLSKSNVTNIKPLNGLVKLKILDLTETAVNDLEPLRKLSNLEELYLGNTKVSSLEPLTGLKNLDTLQFFNTEVSDLEPLKGLTNLRVLSVFSNKLTNLEPLRNLAKLEEIVLVEKQVYDIEPISQLKKLENLNINNSLISNIEPLKELSALKRLNINNCHEISDKQVEDLQKALPNLKIMK